VFVEQTVTCEYVLVTDGDILIPEGWRVHPVAPSHRPPRFEAKRAKCEPWRYADADIYIWLDGSILPQPGLVQNMLECLGDQEVAFHPHPQRTTLTAEVLASEPLPKYAGQEVAEQAEHYIRSGHPDNWGLWAAGLFAMRDTDRTRTLGRRWLEEIERWTLQDQISLPPVLREMDLRPATLAGGLLGNLLFTIRQHSDGT
jgi:hypothetical protein